MKTPVYNAIFLTPKTEKRLRKILSPKHPNVFLHHVTLEFKPDAPPELEGYKIVMALDKYFKDDKCECVTVFIPPALKYVGPSKPHITISTAEGVKPFASNKLINTGNGILCSRNPYISIDGTLESFYG